MEYSLKERNDLFSEIGKNKVVTYKELAQVLERFNLMIECNPDKKDISMLKERMKDFINFNVETANKETDKAFTEVKHTQSMVFDVSMDNEYEELDNHSNRLALQLINSNKKKDYDDFVNKAQTSRLYALAYLKLPDNLKENVRENIKNDILRTSKSANEREFDEEKGSELEGKEKVYASKMSESFLMRMLKQQEDAIPSDYFFNSENVVEDDSEHYFN